MVSGDDPKGKEKFHVEKLKNTPGIYYEEIGALRLVKGIWKTAIHMDLDQIKEKEEPLRTVLIILKKKCKETSNDMLCSTITNNLEPMMEKLHGKIEAIYDFVGKSDKRMKRGLINGLGTVIKSITGNLDQEDAEKIDEKINGIIGKQITDEETLKENLQILQSSISIYNKTINEVGSDINSLEFAIKKVQTEFSNKLSEIGQKQVLDGNINTISTVIESFTEELDQLANFLMQARKGLINPTVISPQQLTNYLTIATPYIPRGLNFATEIKRSEITNLLKSAEITTYTSRARVVLVIKFPLIESILLKVNKVYPLPVRMSENKFQFIETNTRLIIINGSTRNYLILTEEELNKSKKVDSVYYYKPKQAIQTVTRNTPCEIKLYLEESPEESSCTQRIVKLEKTIIIALEQEGRWLFTAPKIEKIRVECEKENTLYTTIYDNGILALDGKCSVTSADYQLLTLNEMTQNEFIRFSPSYNLTNTLGKFDSNHPAFNYSIPHKMILNPLEINKLGERIDILKTKLNEQPKNWVPQYHIIGSYSLSSILFLIIIIICTISYIIYKKKQRQLSMRAPQVIDIERLSGPQKPPRRVNKTPELSIIHKETPRKKTNTDSE